MQGNQLLHNGVPWVPHGVQIVGIVAPDNALSDKYVPAHAHFGEAELQAAVAAHADLVRFQVSEFGLDPLNLLYSPAYVQEVQSAVALAHGLGLQVIVSLQAEPPAGEPTRCPLPDQGAARVWSELASMFGQDSDVMFELYNEPAVPASVSGWQAWLNGGVVASSTGPCEAVGMQALIDEIRSAGAGNVIVVPGLAGEQSLAGMPVLTDPAYPSSPQLAYGVHYPALTRPSTSWDRAFGNVSARVPVLITEWDANATTNCLADAPERASLLLDYLNSKGIGIVGFAFDLPGTIIADWSYTPTTYSGFQCGDPDGGPGQLLLGDFSAEARAGAPAVVPAWLVSTTSLMRLVAAGPQTAARSFDTPRTYVTGTGAAGLAALGTPTAIATESFSNENTLAAAANGGRLRAGTKAVVYADGDTRRTPKAQQRHPGEYYQRAAQVAHAHGLLLIAAPALDLIQGLSPRTPPNRQGGAFLRLRIAALAARYADVYVVQDQDDELHPARFASFVAAASRQARNAHPSIEVLNAISTSVGNRVVPASQVMAALQLVEPQLSGYLLNDALGTTRCGPCSARAAAVGLTLARELISGTG